MGRTNSTYRNHLDSFIDSFKPFRKALRKQNRDYLDSMWEKAHSFASAAAYMNASSPALPAIISVLLGLQRETEQNRQKIERLEDRLEDLER